MVLGWGHDVYVLEKGRSGVVMSYMAAVVHKNHRPSYPYDLSGRSTSGFQRPDRHLLALNAERREVVRWSPVKGELPPAGNRL